MSIDSIENPLSEVVPSDGGESIPSDIVPSDPQNPGDHPSSIFSKDNPILNKYFPRYISQ